MFAVLFEDRVGQLRNSRTRHRAQHVFKGVSTHLATRKQLGMQLPRRFLFARTQGRQHPEERRLLLLSCWPETLRRSAFFLALAIVVVHTIALGMRMYIQWAQKNDPRVTRIGQFMRKTRLDEVPQLWNVLRGDMGFVGPRPERPEFVPWLTEQIPYFNLRHMIRPGLTGWAQVRYGYGSTLAEAREKLEFDLYYIKHMTLGLDLLIMFETVKTILRRQGAQ